MNESAWEKTRRKTRQKILLLLLIVFPLGVVATILLLNNRDLIGFSDNTAGGDSPKTVESTTGILDVGPEEPALPVATGAEINASPPVQSPVTPEKDTVSAAAAIPEKRKKTAPSSGALKVSAAPPVPASDYTELLQPISCRLENRKDVVINLSLELFFTDVEVRSAIRLRREDIKVMVLRAMRYQELSAMKINDLETLLLENIGTIFKHAAIKKVKIRNIQIEKAEHK